MYYNILYEPRKIIIYANKKGKEPYSDWEESLDKVTQAIIKNRLERIRLSNFGDAKIIKNGLEIWELRINYGPGYRIYFSKKREVIVILLMGGDKSSQKSDISKAKRYWSECEDLL